MLVLLARASVIKLLHDALCGFKRKKKTSKQTNTERNLKKEKKEKEIMIYRNNEINK